jgi:hypothetical protein
MKCSNNACGLVFGLEVALPGPSPMSVTRDQMAHPLSDAGPEAGKIEQENILPALALSESLEPPHQTAHPLSDAGPEAGKIGQENILPALTLSESLVPPPSR